MTDSNQLAVSNKQRCNGQPKFANECAFGDIQSHTLCATAEPCMSTGPRITKMWGKWHQKFETLRKWGRSFTFTNHVRTQRFACRCLALHAFPRIYSIGLLYPTADANGVETSLRSTFELLCIPIPRKFNTGEIVEDEKDGMSTTRLPSFGMNRSTLKRPQCISLVTMSFL